MPEDVKESIGVCIIECPAGLVILAEAHQAGHIHSETHGDVVDIDICIWSQLVKAIHDLMDFLQDSRICISAGEVDPMSQGSHSALLKGIL